MTKHNRNLTMTIGNRGHFLWGTWHADTFLMLWSFSRTLQGGYCWFSFLLLLGLQHVQTYSGGHLCFCLVSKGWTVESFYHHTERFKRTLVYFITDTQYASFRVNPLYQATK